MASEYEIKARGKVEICNIMCIKKPIAMMIQSSPNCSPPLTRRPVSIAGCYY